MRISSGFIALATLFGCLTVASADDTGLASIHEWRHAGSKTCFVDHTHDGSGTGATKSAALAEAIRNWQDFTVLEYGTDWGYYRNSIAKSERCSSDTGTVSCQVNSIPCKGGAFARSEPRSTTRRHHTSHLQNQ